MSYQRSRTLLPPSRRPRPRIRPGPYSVPSPGSTPIGSPTPFHVTSVGSPTPYHMSSPQNITSNLANHSRSNTAGKADTDNTVDNFLDAVTGENNNQFQGMGQSDTKQECNTKGDNLGSGNQEVGSGEGEMDGGSKENEGAFEEEGRGPEESSQSSEWGNAYGSQDDAGVVKEEAGNVWFINYLK